MSWKYPKYNKNLQRLPLRGPHEKIELGLMLLGLKPCTLINNIDAGYSNKFDYYVNMGRIIKVGYCFKSESYLYTLPGEEWRAQEILEIYKNPPLNHRRIGFLLGYSYDAINFFVNEKSSIKSSILRKGI